MRIILLCVLALGSVIASGAAQAQQPELRFTITNNMSSQIGLESFSCIGLTCPPAPGGIYPGSPYPETDVVTLFNGTRILTYGGYFKVIKNGIQQNVHMSCRFFITGGKNVDGSCAAASATANAANGDGTHPGCVVSNQTTLPNCGYRADFTMNYLK